MKSNMLAPLWARKANAASIGANHWNTRDSKAVIIVNCAIGIIAKFRRIPIKLIYPNVTYKTGSVVINTETEANSTLIGYFTNLFFICLLLGLKSFANSGFMIISPSTAVTVNNAPASVTAKGFRQIRKTAKPREFSESLFSSKSLPRSNISIIIPARVTDFEKPQSAI